MNIIDELKWRGAVNQQTDEEGLYKLVGEKSISLYCGIDPTGDSMHIGHLIPFMILKRFQLAGHHPVIVIGGGTESCDDVDQIAASINEWRAAGKQVKWDFRSSRNAFSKGNDHYDFLLSGDLRPNAKYLRDKGATELKDFDALQSEIRNADLVVVIGELSAPYAYHMNATSENHAHVAGLEIANAVEDTELFGSLESAAAWIKTALFTTHHDSATLRAALAIPMLAFPERAGRFVDKTGATKTTNSVLKPVQGLESPGQILVRLKTAARPTAGASA